jgi:hypothetical protein
MRLFQPHKLPELDNYELELLNEEGRTIERASSSSDALLTSTSRIKQPSPIAAPFTARTSMAPQHLSSANNEFRRCGSMSTNTQMPMNITAMAEMMLHQW